MATYIVDASVVIEYLVTGTYTINAEAFFEQMTPDDRLIVPEFCLLACTNVIWKQVRFQSMAVPQAQNLLRHLRKLPLRRVPVKAALNAALAIGMTHHLAIYDSAYLALASRSNYPLITIDQPQSRAAAAEGIAVPAITNFSP